MLQKYKFTATLQKCCSQVLRSNILFLAINAMKMTFSDPTLYNLFRNIRVSNQSYLWWFGPITSICWVVRFYSRFNSFRILVLFAGYAAKEIIGQMAIYSLHYHAIIHQMKMMTMILIFYTQRSTNSPCGWGAVLDFMNKITFISSRRKKHVHVISFSLSLFVCHLLTLILQHLCFKRWNWF